jgi:hypothetical protein
MLFSGCRAAESGGKTYTVAVIPQGSTREYSENIHAGAQKACPSCLPFVIALL